jgi:hypothetical protein
LREYHFKHGMVNVRIWGRNKWLLRRWHRPSCFGKKIKSKKLLEIFWKYHDHFATSYKDFRKVAPQKNTSFLSIKNNSNVLWMKSIIFVWYVSYHLWRKMAVIKYMIEGFKSSIQTI